MNTLILLFKCVCGRNCEEAKKVAINDRKQLMCIWRCKACRKVCCHTVGLQQLIEGCPEPIAQIEAPPKPLDLTSDYDLNFLKDTRITL
jgi:hypothetical protein